MLLSDLSLAIVVEKKEFLRRRKTRLFVFDISLAAARLENWLDCFIFSILIYTHIAIPTFFIILLVVTLKSSLLQVKHPLGHVDTAPRVTIPDLLDPGTELTFCECVDAHDL